MVWGCISHDCKLDLVIIRRVLTVLVDRRLLGSQCCSSTGLVANGTRLTKRCNALSSRSDVTRGLCIQQGCLSKLLDVRPLYCSQPTGEKTHRKPTM
jgi:hypothetical protein